MIILPSSSSCINFKFISNAIAQEYDYNNEDNDKYSKYPTAENKYECQKGPFEGFFVSSVEFCKHVKFDKDNDRKDNNRTGTQGPPGPAVHQVLQEQQVLRVYKVKEDLTEPMELRVLRVPVVQ